MRKAAYRPQSWLILMPELASLPSVFVTGTGTGVGKSFFCSEALGYLRSLGFDAGYMKPYCSGGKNETESLLRKAGLTDPFSLVMPESRKHPLAPYASDAVEKRFRRFSPGRIIRALSELKRRHRPVLVEGIGGIMVPLSAKSTVLDLIAALKMPVLIISSPALGTLNHTLMTVRLLKASGAQLIGIVLNPYRGRSLVEKSNASVLAGLAGCRVFTMPFLPGRRKRR